MRLRAFQEQAKLFAEERGFNSISLDRRINYLITEIGEVAKEALVVSDETASPTHREEARENLGLEIYDAVWNLMDIATRCGIDVESAFMRKMEINKHRVWGTGNDNQDR